MIRRAAAAGPAVSSSPTPQPKSPRLGEDRPPGVGRKSFVISNRFRCVTLNVAIRVPRLRVEHDRANKVHVSFHGRAVYSVDYLGDGPYLFAPESLSTIAATMNAIDSTRKMTNPMVRSTAISATGISNVQSH